MRLNVDTWERQEREDWAIVMPLAGNKANDSTLLNPTAAKIYAAFKDGQNVDAIWNEFRQTYPDVPEDRLWADILGCLRYLLYLELVELTQKELEHVFNRNKQIPAGLAILDEPDVFHASDLLRDAITGERGAKCFFSIGTLTEDTVQPWILRHHHVQGVQTLFVNRDEEKGQINGLVGVQNTFLPSPKIIGLIATRTNGHPNGAQDLARRMLGNVETILKEAFDAHKLRVLRVVYGPEAALPETTNQANCQSCLQVSWDEMAPLIGEFGYRREAVLTDEYGPGVTLEYYVKNLSTASKPTEGEPA